MADDLSPSEIIEKIISADLIGRGGAGYPTGIKWKQMFSKNHQKIYLIVNGSEGEPGTKKDGYILKNHIDELINGIKIAYKVFSNTTKIYIYLRKDYFDEYRLTIENKTKDFPVEIFKEPGGYLCGENTVLINSIEGKRYEPRRKPPYCSEVGLRGLPTLVNNLETFYRVSQIIKGDYEDKSLYSISGDTKNPGVYDLNNDINIIDLLKITKNEITDDHFVLVGGGGKYFIKEEINKQTANIGTGAVIIYNSKKINLVNLMVEKLTFLLAENCGKCTPCREGVFRLKELVDAGKIEESEAAEVIYTMSETSFCGLGSGAGESFTSLWEKKDKIWKK